MGSFYKMYELFQQKNLNEDELFNELSEIQMVFKSILDLKKSLFLVRFSCILTVNPIQIHQSLLQQKFYQIKKLKKNTIAMMMMMIH